MASFEAANGNDYCLVSDCAEHAHLQVCVNISSRDAFRLHSLHGLTNGAESAFKLQCFRIKVRQGG